MYGIYQFHTMMLPLAIIQVREMKCKKEIKNVQKPQKPLPLLIFPAAYVFIEMIYYSINPCSEFLFNTIIFPFMDCIIQRAVIP